MKKFAIISAFLLATAGAFADSYPYTYTLTNTQPITYSDALPISGWLDKIEVATEAASTTTVTVATYSGTLAVDTYYSDTISATTNGALGAGQAFDIARTRFIGTSNDGTAFTASQDVTGTSVVTRVLSAPYERPMLGGNVKVALTGTKNDGSCPVTVTIFYTPVAH